MTLYLILYEMLPNADGERKLRMHGPVYLTAEERDRDYAELRWQNLPFKMFLFEVEDPR